MLYITWQCPSCKNWQIQGLFKYRKPEDVILRCKYQTCRAERKLLIKDKHLGHIRNVAVAYIGNSPKEARMIKWRMSRKQQ